VRLITAAVIVGLVAFVIAMLPKSFSEDLSRIGSGANVVVLVHNKNAIESQHLMDLLNAVRGDYAPQIEFLVADVDTDNGKAFMRTQQVGAAVLLLFGPDGTRHGVLSGPLDKAGLRAALDAAYGRNR
jgi:hypothetical protein